MSYDLRRLRLHHLIERIPKSHRYLLTSFSLRAALFFTRVYNRILRPGMARITPGGAGSGKFDATHLVRPARETPSINGAKRPNLPREQR